MTSESSPINTEGVAVTIMYQLTFYVPTKDTSAVLAAVHATGAGTWPNSPEELGTMGNNDNITTTATSTGAAATLPPPPAPKYVEAAFITRGTGQFRPTEHADPHIGSAGGQVEYVVEDKVEMVVVGTELMRRAVAALRAAHPYEVVAFFVTRCETV